MVFPEEQEHLRNHSELFSTIWNFGEARLS